MSAMQETTLAVEQDGPVVTLTIANPALRNALGPAVYKGLGEITERVKSDPSIRAVVLTGAGDIFCGGGNLNRIRDNQATRTREYQAASIEVLHTAVRAMRRCPVPFIAAVEGVAAGAGFSLAMQCDLIVAAEDARFIMAYVNVGLTPDGGGSAMLGALLPRQLAFEVMALGEPVSATRLKELGVVARCVPHGEALSAAQALARRLAAGPAGAIGRIKRLAEQAALQDRQLDLERDLFVESLFGAEAKEGIGAFLEKRKPDFL
jgi:enoyl-CoA hydratase/carnithine racemase